MPSKVFVIATKPCDRIHVEVSFEDNFNDIVKSKKERFIATLC